MAGETTETADLSNASFLRRLGHSDDLSQGPYGAIVKPKAFRAKARDFSITLRGTTLQTDDQVKAYQESWRIPPSGDLPGICTFSHLDLTQKVKPPLHPLFEKDNEDHQYGHLHYVIGPIEPPQRHVLATVAIVLLGFVPGPCSNGTVLGT